MQGAKQLGAGILVLFMCGMGSSLSWGQEYEEAPSAVSVADYTFCTGVEDHEPVGPASTFEPDVGRVYLWTDIHADEPPLEIKHVWYYGDTKMTEVPLRIGYTRTRTWSSKTILEDWTGEWRVDVVNGDGEILKRVNFTIGG